MNISVPINVELPDNWAELIAQKLIDRGDVVLVVRCQDCVRRDECRTQSIWAVPPDDDWYCADGERRADE